MRKSIMALIISILGVGFIFGGVGLVTAQETDMDEFTLQEITVTAQKREENQQKVPIAMEVLSGEKFSEMGMNNVDEILRDISNVIINKSSDGMRISLRGLADNSSLNMSNQHVSTPTVAVNVDGAYNNRSNAGQNLYDVERVEVLFGPQSTMYASNSPGGIVNVVTADPKTDKYSASGSIEYGSYDLLNLQGVFNAPVYKDKIAMRLAAYTSKRDSFVSEDETGMDTKSVRLKALLQPNEDLSFVVTGNYTKKGSGGMMGGSVVPFGDEDEVADPWTPVDDEGGGNTNDEETKGIKASIDWDTSIGSLVIVPSYSESTSSGLRTSTDMSGAITTSLNDMSNTQEEIEGRMTSAEDFPFEWILGANYYESEDKRSSDYLESDRSTTSLNNQDSHAFFGNITYPFTDKFRGTAGYRRSWDTVKNYSEELNKPGGGPGGTTGDMISDTITEYDSPDYKIGIEYDLAENMMIFANYATSYRMQGMGMANAEGETAPPEKLESYTIGSKNRFFGNKLQVNASAYYYDYANKTANQMKADAFYEDAQIFIDAGYEADDGTPGIDMNNDGTITHEMFELHDRNSQTWGDFRSIGADIQTSWIAGSNDRLNVSVSYLNSEWTELIFDYEYDVAYPAENYTGVVNTYAPEWTINANYEHNFNLPDGGVITGRIDGQYQTEYILTWTEADRPYSYQEPHYIMNVSGVYAHPSGNWTLSAYVDNIFDYAKKTSYMMEDMMIGDPRTFGAVLSLKY